MKRCCCSSVWVKHFQNNGLKVKYAGRHFKQAAETCLAEGFSEPLGDSTCGEVRFWWVLELFLGQCHDSESDWKPCNWPLHYDKRAVSLFPPLSRVRSLSLLASSLFFHLSYFPFTVVGSAEAVQEDRGCILSQITSDGSGWKVMNEWALAFGKGRR